MSTDITAGIGTKVNAWIQPSVDNLLGLVKQTLAQSGLDADVELSGDEIILTVKPESAAKLLMQSIPAQYKGAISVKEVGRIVLGIKLR